MLILLLKEMTKAFVRLSNNDAAYWGKKTKGGRGFRKTLLKTAINHLIENCYFNIWNVTIKQAIDISMGIDPAPFWANLFLCSYEEEYMSSLISSDKFKVRQLPLNKALHWWSLSYKWWRRILKVLIWHIFQ